MQFYKEVFIMHSEEIRKKVAYDLTMEYVKQNNVMRNPTSDSPISARIEKIEQIYNEIFEVLKNKNIL